MELSLLYLLDIGSMELPVDFRNSYRASWLGTLQYRIRTAPCYMDFKLGVYDTVHESIYRLDFRRYGI
jgi:hypothetical protein